jgi:DnaJ-class molecular chaperone
MPWLLAVPITLTLVTLGYAVTCLVAPTVPCRRCHATGTRRARFRLVDDYCRSCHGRGARIRAGTRWWASVRTDTTRERPDREP